MDNCMRQWRANGQRYQRRITIRKWQTYYVLIRNHDVGSPPRLEGLDVSKQKAPSKTSDKERVTTYWSSTLNARHTGGQSLLDSVQGRSRAAGSGKTHEKR